MEKKVGDLTIREVVEMCEKSEICTHCPLREAGIPCSAFLDSMPKSSLDKIIVTKE